MTRLAGWRVNASRRHGIMSWHEPCPCLCPLPVGHASGLHAPHAPAGPQVQKLNLGLPGHLHGYTYVLVSICTAGALGLLIYGTAVWTQ